MCSYAADIEKYTQGAHPITETFRKESQYVIMREIFIAGLLPLFRENVMSKEPKTFHEALNEANKIEARNYLLRGQNPTVPSVKGYQAFLVRDKDVPLKLRHGRDVPCDSRGEVVPYSKKSRYALGQRSNAESGRKSHLDSKDTRSRVFREADDASSSDEGAMPRYEGVFPRCYYCHKRGHSLKNCWTKQRDDELRKRKHRVHTVSTKLDQASDDSDDDAINDLKKAIEDFDRQCQRIE